MIFRSVHPDVAIPETTVTAYVLRHADRLRDKPAMIDGPSGRTLTYGQLSDGIRRVATALHQRGFRKGDVLAVYSPNLPEYAVVFNAVASLGGITTTVNPLYTAGELANQLTDSRACCHIYGLVVIMKLGLANGSTIVSMPRFDMLEFLGAVQKYRVTILPLVPPIVLGMVKHPAVAQFDLSTVRMVFS